MTLDEGTDPEDGSPINAVQRQALALLDRTEDDMTDAELMGRASEEHWYMGLCMERFHRLPSEVDLVLGCREYTALRAHGVVARAIDDMQRKFRDSNPARVPGWG